MIEHTIGSQYRIRLNNNKKLEMFKYNQPYTNQDNTQLIIAMLLEIDKLKKLLSPTNVIKFPKDIA